MMRIHFDDEERWVNAIYLLMQRGATFEAWDYGMCTYRWCIDLTGGY